MPIKNIVAFGSIKTLTSSLPTFSKFLKSEELAKSILYEYPLHPDLSTPITIESSPFGALDNIFFICFVAFVVNDKKPKVDCN